MTDPVANIIENRIALKELKALVGLAKKKYGEDLNNIPKEDLEFITEVFKYFRQLNGKGRKDQPVKGISFMMEELQFAC